jgi:endonuclease/exonuclease/phosphatase family metal-dependent hydrolase
MSQVSKFRIVTYNVHKCVGIDRRLDPARIVSVLKEIKESRLHVYNLHLGTSFVERRSQARKLISESILSDGKNPGPRIMLGDFNEWTRGLVTRLLNGHFRTGDIRLHLKRSRTYPGLLPVMHLDHIYFDETLELEHAELHRSRAALLASDHLPIFADFRSATA